MAINTYTLFTFFCFAQLLCFSQTTNTLSSGLNDNEVNVVRDGDFAEEAGGVIKMVPKGKKEKVMTVVTDSLDGKPVGTPTHSMMPKDSTIRFKDTAASNPIKIKSKSSSSTKKPKTTKFKTK